MTHQPQPTQAPDVGAQPCPRCGATCRPLLTQGTGHHAIRASCAHCGRFIRWISVLAPAERHARRMKARLEAMQQLKPSAAQLTFLKDLGDQGPAPETMSEASERIERLKGA